MRREAEEEANDVRKVGHMGNFYSNLLTKNVALGKGPAAKPKEEAEAQQAQQVGLGLRMINCFQPEFGSSGSPLPVS